MNAVPFAFSLSSFSHFPDSSKEVPDPVAFSFLPPQSLAVVAVWAPPNQLAKKSIHVTAGQSGRGEVEAGADPSPGELFLGKLQSALRAHLPAVRL